MEKTQTAAARETGVKLTLGSIAVASGAVFFWLNWSPARSREMQPVQNHVAQPVKLEEEATSVDQPQLAKVYSRYKLSPVPTNRSADVAPAFRGEVHPWLHGKTSLEVAAHWTKVGRGRDGLDSAVPPSVYALFTDLAPATANKIYTERDFSPLLPDDVESVGQIWEIDSDAVATFLRQFHPQPSLHLIALGRRAGPDGAFGFLRAVSATHLDILFRIHAEFDLALNVWYTPACFWGRMIVDKQAGTVESFRLWLPTDQPLNVHLTVAGSVPQGKTKPEYLQELKRGGRIASQLDIVHVDQMELVSANPKLADELDWLDSIDVALAKHELTKAFYAFSGINWVPWEAAVKVAGEQHKPILAVVLWGALDDQSC